MYLHTGRQLAARLHASQTWPEASTQLPPPPLVYLWPEGPEGDPYMGAAHGLMGVLHVLLHVMQYHGEEVWGAELAAVRRDVEASLRWAVRRYRLYCSTTDCCTNAVQTAVQYWYYLVVGPPI